MAPFNSMKDRDITTLAENPGKKAKLNFEFRPWNLRPRKSQSRDDSQRHDEQRLRY